MLKKDFNDQNVKTKTSKNQIKLATHQTIFILWLPVDHLHVLDPAKKKEKVVRLGWTTEEEFIKRLQSHLVFTMSTGIEAAVVTRPLIILAQK